MNSIPIRLLSDGYMKSSLNEMRNNGYDEFLKGVLYGNKLIGNGIYNDDRLKYDNGNAVLGVGVGFDTGLLFSSSIGFGSTCVCTICETGILCAGPVGFSKRIFRLPSSSSICERLLASKISIISLTCLVSIPITPLIENEPRSLSSLCSTIYFFFASMISITS